MAPARAQYGLEDATADDMELPHWILTQALSKFVTEEGYPVGFFVNTLSKKKAEFIEFIPFKMTKYVKLLKAEGGRMKYEGRVTDESDERLKGRRYFPTKDGQGNVIRPNAESVIAILALVDGSPAILKFSKTSHRAGKEIITMAKMAGGNFWDFKYKLSAKKNTGDSGSYYTQQVSQLGGTTEEDRAVAWKYYGAMAGKAAAVADASEPTDGAGADEETVPF